MAGGDRRGPDGKGPLTGRGLGDCAGNDKSVDTAGGGFWGRVGRGFFGRGRDGGMARGTGMGRGRNKRNK